MEGLWWKNFSLALIKKLLLFPFKWEILVFPRDSFQSRMLRSKFGNSIVVPNSFLDPLFLFSRATAVVGGGTMSSEAAFCGIPSIYNMSTISFYSYALPPVQKWLVNMGLLKHITNPEQIVNELKQLMIQNSSNRKNTKKLIQSLTNPIEVLLSIIHKLEVS